MEKGWVVSHIYNGEIAVYRTHRAAAEKAADYSLEHHMLDDYVAHSAYRRIEQGETDENGNNDFQSMYKDTMIKEFNDIHSCIGGFMLTLVDVFED